MADRQPSRTALGVAFLRAAHQLLDSEPRILDDSVIVSLIGHAGVQRIADLPQSAQTAAARGLRAHVVLRSRFAEDRLQLAVRRGVAQYVLLGAGYDTFAYRQPDWARPLRIFEIDQPATQTDKKARLAGAGVAIPANVHFADVDFERESLRQGLVRHGISLDEPTFFSWLGVTMYLTEQAIDAVLETVAEFPVGSEIVLTFSPRPGQDDPAAGPTLAERAAEAGEPWISYFEPEEIEQKLRRFGFSTVEFLTPDESRQRYFRDRADELPPPRRTTIVSAIR